MQVTPVNLQKLILIVDDDVLLAQSLSEQFSLHKEFTTHLVHTAGEGLQWIKGAAADLVLLDVGLPDGNGLDLLGELRDAREHFVFVPAVPYSGSLKSHLTAPLAAWIDPARAFALVSVAFFALAVAAACRLAWRAGGRRAAWGAGLYLALAPAFVTQYSLSNDGNYVEVLALGPWALLVALRAADVARPRTPRLLAGLLLGLAFWCHILALIPALAGGLVAALSLFPHPADAFTKIGAVGQKH